MEDQAENLLNQRERFLRYIQSKLSDPDLAEDVLQESLLKALRAAPALRAEDRLIPWFYRILNNAIIDVYRRRGRDSKYLGGDIEQYELEIEPEEEEVLCGCFRELLPTLKPEYAQVIDALELSGGDPEQVAAGLGITRNNLKVRRHRARQALRRRLEETCRTCAAHGCLDCTCAA